MRARAVAPAIVTIVAAGAACRDRATLPPLPEVVVVADTNLPVPLVAARLRVDLYAEDGTWFDSTDVGRPTAREWPASFGVYSDDDSRETRVFVRLRAYAEGRTTKYRGERFRDGAARFEDPPGDDEPRLVVEGEDRTPATEPSPLLAVDRLVLLRLVPGVRGRARVLLHGACAGTMAKLGPGGRPSIGVASSCVDTPNVRVRVDEEPVDTRDDDGATATEAGTWERASCASVAASSDRPRTRAPRAADRICVEGGATILGSDTLSDYSPGTARLVDAAPARVFAVRSFLMDKDEVTVARVREAAARGFSGRILANEGSMTDDGRSCTYNTTRHDRDDWAVNCVSWEAARAFCRFGGGDLPTEAQWEHAASTARRATKARFPWGDEPPTCERSVYGRADIFVDQIRCDRLGKGTRPPIESARDVSTLGIVAMHGNLHEWTRDEVASYRAPCWQDASIVEPTCAGTGAQVHVGRGAAWLSEPFRNTTRNVPTNDDPRTDYGFRCVYPVEGAP